MRLVRSAVLDDRAGRFRGNLEDDGVRGLDEQMLAMLKNDRFPAHDA